MALTFKSHGFRFETCPFGVSGRRLLEHLTLGQINPFGIPMSTVRSAADAAGLVDLVRSDDELGGTLIGLTLAGLADRALSARLLGAHEAAVRHAVTGSAVTALLAGVVENVRLFAERTAARNLPAPFLPPAAGTDLLGVPGLRSRLCEHLATQARAKAPAPQWVGTLNNLATKGLRNEELQQSGLIALLEKPGVASAMLTGEQLIDSIDFARLRLSVIANIDEARSQLQFEVASERSLAKTKGEARAQHGQQRRLSLFDRVMGYRVEEVGHPALWGRDQHWQAVTFEGKLLRDRATRRAIFASPELAMARAEEHAREVLPKMRATGRWAKWSWIVGADPKLQEFQRSEHAFSSASVLFETASLTHLLRIGF